MSKEIPRCPFCNNQGDECEHLLLTTDASGEVIDGLLYDDAAALDEAFREIFEEVARRDAVCGSGLLLEATRAFLRGYGYIAGTQVPHAELNRNFAVEYLMDQLDRAPNLERIRCGTAADTVNYIWSEAPQTAQTLIAKSLKELRRLASLPLGAPEWRAAILE